MSVHLLYTSSLCFLTGSFSKRVNCHFESEQAILKIVKIILFSEFYKVVDSFFHLYCHLAFKFSPKYFLK